MWVPWYLWGESLWVCYFIPVLMRYTLVLNATWLVNSAAHMWGNRPYDHNINPSENRFVAFSAIGKDLTLKNIYLRGGFVWSTTIVQSLALYRRLFAPHLYCSLPKAADAAWMV
jgi:hypothetical protein